MAADAAATDAMRAALKDALGVGTIVIGEGAKDEAPMLYTGGRLGRGGEPSFDIAVDPLECTDYLARVCLELSPPSRSPSRPRSGHRAPASKWTKLWPLPPRGTPSTSLTPQSGTSLAWLRHLGSPYPNSGSSCSTSRATPS
jgi:hypothetical protein